MIIMSTTTTSARLIEDDNSSAVAAFKSNGLKSLSSRGSSSSSASSSTTTSTSSIANSLQLNSYVNNCNENQSAVAGSSKLNGRASNMKHSASFLQLQKSSTSKMNSNAVELMCLLCKRKLVEPKLLNCLHTFCKQCLISHCSMGDLASISCPKCKQETKVNGSNGVESLEDDYVMVNMLDMLSIKERILDCTSCKTEEKAVARCADCAQFLCPNCVSAHQYMRCFENHTVVNFDDIRKNYQGKQDGTSDPQYMKKQFVIGSENGGGGNDDVGGSSQIPIHKPLFCRAHQKENLRYFCLNCQVPVCTECIVSFHPQPMHVCERICDLEAKTIDELELIIVKTKERIDICHKESQVMDSYQLDLQDQMEYSRNQIEETYNLYKTVLERKRIELLRELEEKYSYKEQGIADLNSAFENSIGQLSDLIKFTERVLKNGNSQEILLLKRLIQNQAKFLFSNLPQIDKIDINLKFMTDEKRFERAIDDFFGHFYPDKEFKQVVPFPNPSQAYSSKPTNQLQHLPQNHHYQEASSQQYHHQYVGFKPINLQPPTPVPVNDNEWSLLAPTRTNYNGLIIDQHQNHNNINQYTSSSNNPVLAADRRLVNESSSLASASAAGGGTTPTEELISNLLKLPLNATQSQIDDLQNQFLHSSVSPSSAAQLMLNFSNPKLTAQQQQIILNGMTMGNNNNGPNNQQQFYLDGLMAVHASTAVANSRSQTPGISSNSSRAPVTTANHGNKLFNGLEEFLQFGGGSASSGGSDSKSNITQNFNHLSKLIAPSTSDFNAFSSNLQEELGLTNNGHVFSSDAHSNSSKSPPVITPSTAAASSNSGVIGSGLSSVAAASQMSAFIGNGNLNPPIRQNVKMENMSIKTKYGSLGSGKAQFNSPHGFCLGVNEEIIVADTNNHRIQVFDKNAEFKYSFGSPGREEGQLWYPRKVTVMRQTGKFVVCDRGNERSRMQIFSRTGHFMRKISIRYIDIVAGLAITQEGDIVAVDSVSPTVFRISEDGDILKWFECSEHMREPSDIAISGNEYFICDFKGHCVVVFNDNGDCLRRIGGENLTNFPNGIDVSDAGDVLVGDSHGNRFHVAVFSREGILMKEFECPYVKVSRCCGLKITSEGYVVTLAKNNHHVLILDTLYVS